MVASSVETLETILKTDLVLRAISEALDVLDPKAVSHALSALEELLSIGNIGKYNQYATDFHVAGGLDKLEILVNHANSVVSNKAKRLIDKYFYIPASVEHQVEDEAEKEVNKEQSKEKGKEQKINL